MIIPFLTFASVKRKQIKEMLLLQKYKLTIIGIFIGAVAGFLYWHEVGCASGTCAITSSPVNSSLYGALMGALLANIFQTDKQN